MVYIYRPFERKVRFMIILKSNDLLFRIKQVIQMLKYDANLFIFFNIGDTANTFNVK